MGSIYFIPYNPTNQAQSWSLKNMWILWILCGQLYMVARASRENQGSRTFVSSQLH